MKSGGGRKVRTPSPTKLVGDKRAAGNTRRGYRRGANRDGGGVSRSHPVIQLGEPVSNYGVKRLNPCPGARANPKSFFMGAEGKK